MTTHGSKPWRRGSARSSTVPWMWRCATSGRPTGRPPPRERGWSSNRGSWRAFPTNGRPPGGGGWVGHPPWEFGGLPDEWVAALADVDEVWCPSEFVRSSYVLSGV